MNSSDIFENTSDIIFKHKISLKDLMGKFKYSVNFLGILWGIIFSVAFYSPSLIKNFSSVLFLKIWFFLLIMTIFDIALTVFFTRAKIVLTKNSIFYKPPVSFKIYSFHFDEIGAFVKNRFFITVFGKNPQKRFTVFLYGKIAEEFISILQKLIPELRDYTPKKSFDFATNYDKYFSVFCIISIFFAFSLFPISLFLKSKIGDFYFSQWEKSGYSIDVYRKCALDNYKFAVLNERNSAYCEKFLLLSSHK
ncbi:MAG: hypothetical protein ACI37Z_06085 [Candidatus Gastranaerophilaceae bacterium]